MAYFDRVPEGTKPCPFCGSDDLNMRYAEGEPVGVECNNCNAEGPQDWITFSIDPLAKWNERI